MTIQSGYLSARSKYQQAKTALTQAENAVTENESAIANLQNQLAAAQAKQKINQLDMEETYQETVITGQNAQTTYNATVEDLKETLQEAEETKEKREEQLQAFEDFVGSDGILYAAEDGVITGAGYEAGDRLTTTGIIFSYATADDMRISVDVTQEDIVDLQVGDAVYITFTAYPEDSYSLHQYYGYFRLQQHGKLHCGDQRRRRIGEAVWGNDRRCHFRNGRKRGYSLCVP